MQLVTDPDKWALYDHPAAPSYVKGNFCLAGDAAHATTPHSGAGAGMAIDDAHMLSVLLTPDLIKSRADIKFALKAYDEVRRPRSQQIVARSRRQGMMLDLQTEDGGTPTKEELKSSMEGNMRWIWGVDLEAMVKIARNLVNRYIEED
jgi:salicylate hydroxylase